MFYLNPMFDSMLFFNFSKKLSRSRKIEFNFRNQWNCNFYSLESAAKANDVEMAEIMVSQEFAFHNRE